jgi:hypothetical protein
MKSIIIAVMAAIAFSAPHQKTSGSPWLSLPDTAMAVVAANEAEASEPTILSVEGGHKSAALQALKNKGIKAVELKNAPFVLPSVKLVGVSGPVDFGEIVQLKASVDRDTLPDNLVSLKYQWTVYEDGHPKQNVIIWPDGTQIIFAAGMHPKKIIVMLSVNCLFEDKKNIKVVDKDGKPIDGAKVVTEDGKPVEGSIIVASESNAPDPIIQEIVIGGNVPEPQPQPPTPSPNPAPQPPSPQPQPPTPAPVLPAGTFGLSQKAFDLANANVDAAVKGPSAVTLGNSYLGVVDEIKSAKSKVASGVPLGKDDVGLDVSSILKFTKQKNGEALGSLAKSWVQWNKLYGDEIYKLYTAKKLVTPDDWITAFEETAQGLKAVH